MKISIYRVRKRQTINKQTRSNIDKQCQYAVTTQTLLTKGNLKYLCDKRFPFVALEFTLQGQTLLYHRNKWN